MSGNTVVTAVALAIGEHAPNIADLWHGAHTAHGCAPLEALEGVEGGAYPLPGAGPPRSVCLQQPPAALQPLRNCQYLHGNRFSNR